MGHPRIDNRTPFAALPLFMNDASGSPIVVPVIKATYGIVDGNRLVLAESQLPVTAAGAFWYDADPSSYKYEPETAYIKPASDIVLIGHAWPAGGPAREVRVTLQVGALRKSVQVSGDRYWVKALGVPTMTRPEPFVKMPLVFERAFGGWDRSHPDPNRHAFEPRNPVGSGFRHATGRFEEGIRLPNLEDPRHPVKHYGDTPPPAGVGFTAVHWQPRAAFAGTYDAAWQANRFPRLPEDFDLRFFNAAPQDQIYPGYLKGDEPVAVTHASPDGTIAFRLPGIAPPVCTVTLRGRQTHQRRTHLDTLIVNTDENLLVLLWRTHLTLKSGPQDVDAITIESASMPHRTA